MQQHATTFFEQAEAAVGADLPQFVKDEFNTFLECGILDNGFLGLRCGDCGHDNLVANSSKRRGFCPSYGTRFMAQTAVDLVEDFIPRVPVCQWVLALPIPLRLLLAAQPKLVTSVLQVAHIAITRFLLDQAVHEANSGRADLALLIGRCRLRALPVQPFPPCALQSWLHAPCCSRTMLILPFTSVACCRRYK